jgi:D-amino-acid dehydrogenase
MKVTVIGAGVIGLCCAYYLQKEGFEVTVVERNDLTDGCSFGNMGYVSPSHFIPLATPGIISQGAKWMMSASSPFYIKPRFNIDLIKWGMQFWKKANAQHVEASAPHLNNLLQLSRALTIDLKNDLENSFEFLEKGVWMLYKSAKTGEHEKHLADQANSYGLKTIICNAQQVQDYEKEVEVNVAGGVLYIDDCHLNPAAFIKSLHNYLQKVGVTFQLNTEVVGFEKHDGIISKVITNKGDVLCDEVVIANGSWMQNISKLLGIELLMQPGKGYSFEYNNLDKNLLYPSILVDDRVATTPIDRWLRMGGTMELSGHSDNILPKRVSSIYNAFKKYYPSLAIPAPDANQAWFGYRPVSPDGMPYIGRHSKLKNISYAGGHAMLGVSAAAGTGKLISEILLGKNTTIGMAAFSPERNG